MTALSDLMARRPVFLSSEARDAGVTRREMKAAFERGDVVPVCHGVIATEAAHQDGRIHDAAVALRTNGILALRGAAMRHGLTTDLPRHHEYLVPRQSGVSPPFPYVRLVRTGRPDALKLGVDEEDVLGVRFRITNPARTVVDLWRTGFPLGIPHQFLYEAVHGFVADRGDLNELIETARAFGPAVAERLEIAVSTCMTHPTF